jgi:hypothetical protein
VRPADRAGERDTPRTDDGAALHLPVEARAAHIEASREVIPALDLILEARQSVYQHIGEPGPSAFWSIVRNMEAYDDVRLAHPMAAAGGIHSRLPTDMTEWWLHLARSGADFGLPTPDEMDARSTEYGRQAKRARSDGPDPRAEAEAASAEGQRDYFQRVGSGAA